MTHHPPHIPRGLVDFGLLDQGARASLNSVEAQFFPLLADRGRLQSFLDQRYNHTLRGCDARFELIRPVVLFAVLYYPTMHGYERAEASILRQDEYYYLIPVRLHRNVGGREQVEIGVVIPYVYVTSPISTPVGRELFGWQKDLYRVRSVVPRGIRPSQDEPYLVIERPVPGRDEGGLEYRTVVEAHYRSTVGNLAHLPKHALSALQRLPAEAARFARTELGEWLRPGGVGSQADLARIVGSILRPNDAFNVYAMPQVPHPSVGWIDQDELLQYAAAFQALTRTNMRVRQIRDIAPLGHSPLTALDPSGGFSLRVRSHGIGQVVSRLGLHVSESHDDGTPGGLSHVLHPYHPFSARFDLEVEGLATLAQRTVRSPWYDAGGVVLGHEPGGDAAPYNTHLGPHLAEGYTSYSQRRHEQHYRMLGVRAPIERLRALCRDIAPTPPEMTLRPLEVEPGRGVVAVVLTRLPPSAGTEERLEWFAGLYLNVAVVAELSWRGHTTMVFVETHGFTENPHAFLVGRELLGANRWLMEVDESPQRWVPTGYAPGGNHVLSMRTSALRTLNAGERVEMSPFLEVLECEGSKAPGELGVFSPHIERLFAARELAYLRVHTVRTTNEHGALQPALVRANIELVRFARDGQPVPTPSPLVPHELMLYPYPSMPLVEQLGLTAETVESDRFDDSAWPTPQRVHCDFAVGGQLPATRRGVLTLYDWSAEGWNADMAPWFFDPAVREEASAQR